MSQIISRKTLLKLIGSMVAAGKTVIGPAAAGERYFFQVLKKADSVVIDPAIMPANSIKEFLFPRHETLCRYHYEGKKLILLDAEPFTTEQVIFGARACDAASLPILDKVFSWDFQDRFYQERRAKTTVVTLVCRGGDKNCFCTSVGLAPDSPDGSDAMLLDLGDGSFEVRCFTDKGRVIFDGNTAASDKVAVPPKGPEIRFDVKRVEKYLADHFDDPVYAETSLRCVGCGACTYVCPTCHCFDIVDEGGPMKGERVKNWDTCQFAMFSHHASGHNPRSNQAVRQRNRVQHKFCIYPGKFGVILCTGCGNCTRECSATLGIWPLLELIDEKAK